MVSPFQTALNTCFTVAQQFAGETATLSREINDAIVSVSITVILGETRVEEALQNDNIIVSTRIRDMLVLADDYDFGSGAVEPALGDKFTLSIAGQSLVYEVVPIAGEREFRTHDRQQNSWRVHSKQVS